MSNLYEVTVAYTGECCMSAHLLIRDFAARDHRGAARKAIRMVKRRGQEPGTVVIRPKAGGLSAICEAGEWEGLDAAT